MNSPIGNSGVPPVFTPFVSNDSLLSDVGDIRQNGAQAIQAGITELGKIAGNGIAKFSAIMGLPSLAAPKINSSSADIALRIGLLQDALNQLMTEVSKLGLTQKMNEANAKNMEELEKITESIRKNAEAAEKAKEAEKKGNVIDAISNWVQAAVSIVSAVINIVSAIAQAAAAVVTLGGYGYGLVAAGALITSAVALGVVAGGQIALAIDSTMKACGGAGCLTDSQRADCAKVIEVAGYIAMAAGMIGLVGGIASSLSNAAGQVGGALGKESAKQGVGAMAKAAAKEAAQSAAQSVKAAAAKFIDAPIATLKAALQSLINSLKASLSNIFSAAKEGAKEGMEEAVTQGLKTGLEKSVGKSMEEANKIIIREVFSAAYTEGMKSTATAMSRLGVTAAAGGLVNQAATYGGKLEKAELEGEAASLKLDSSKAEADAKAITAQIAKLMKLIEQMQQELSEQMDSGQETLAIINQWLGSAHKTLTTLTEQIAH